MFRWRSGPRALDILTISTAKYDVEHGTKQNNSRYKITPKKIKCFIWTVLNTLHVQISNFLRPMNDGRQYISQPIVFIIPIISSAKVQCQIIILFFFSRQKIAFQFYFPCFCFDLIWKLHRFPLLLIIGYPNQCEKPKIHKTKPKIECEFY